MNILITGFTGFVGSHLTKYLRKEQAFSLTGMTRDKNKTDLKDYPQMDRIVNKEDVTAHCDAETIIHLAGKAHDLKGKDENREYYLANEKLTTELYDAFLASESAKNFIFISTVSVFEKDSGKPYTEEDEPAPATPYSISKLNAEKYIRKQPLPEGKRFYILRPSIIYGPQNKGNLVMLFHFLSKGIPYPLGSFENKRSFLSVENFCFVLKKLINNQGVLPGIYHIADNEVLSTVDVVRLIDSVTQKNIKILRVPVPLVRLAAKAGDILPIPFDNEKLEKLTNDFVISNQKIKLALQTDMPVNTYDGLLDMFKTLNTNK
jgi:nucleoside-diphosphate-sugar epimerase